MITAEQEKSLERFRAHPTLFFDEVLGVKLELYQDEALRLIADNDRVCISACHDVGKSFLLARVVLWFVTCYPYSKVITTAPTFNQVKNILWAEIRTAYARSKFPLGGKMNLTEWQVTPDGDWFAIGFVPRNELSGEAGQGSQSSFQGFHAPYILIVFDEATGIPKTIWTMAEGMLTSDNVKFVAIGNPTSRQTEFYKCFSSPEWVKLKLSCFNSPNLVENGITSIEELEKEVHHVSTLTDDDAQKRLKSYKVSRGYLLTLKWVVAMAMPRKWGLKHPLFLSKVLGLFPEDTADTLIPLGIVEKAQYRIYYPVASDRKLLGVDVARFGSDATVMTALHGYAFLGRKPFFKFDTNEVVGEIIQFAREHGPFDVITIDETGIGGGVVDVLRESARFPANADLFQNTEIRGVQFGASCEDEADRAKFVNLKARMFDHLADDLKKSDGLCLSQDDIYLEELPTILYRFDSKGRKYIESKDDYRKRTGRKSPDDSDSLALANYGRYDEVGVGKFPEQKSGDNRGYGKPFAAGIGSNKQW